MKANVCENSTCHQVNKTKTRTVNELLLLAFIQDSGDGRFMVYSVSHRVTILRYIWREFRKHCTHDILLIWWKLVFDLSSFSMALEVGSLNIKDEINRLRGPGFAARLFYDLGEKSLHLDCCKSIAFLLSTQCSKVVCFLRLCYDLTVKIKVCTNPIYHCAVSSF